MENNQVFPEYDPTFYSQHDFAGMQQQQQQQPQPLLLQQNPQQHQQGFIRWAAQPVTAYQLVPMDYQPVCSHGHQHPLQQVQAQQHPTLYTFSQTSAGPQMTPMAPISPVTPVSPTCGHFMTRSIRRQVSVNFPQMSSGQGAYFDIPTPQYQTQGGFCQPQQQYPVQHALHHSASTPVMIPHKHSGSPEMLSSMPFSPMRRASQSFVPSMTFATPPPAPKKSLENMDVFASSNPGPTCATVPRLASHRGSTAMHRLRKPKSLVLTMPQARRAQQEKGYNGSPTAPKSSAMFFPNETMGGTSMAQSVLPAGSDHEYDGGDSSYSTSPLGSDTNANMRRRARMMASVQTMPAYVRSSFVRAAGESLVSPSPRHSTLSFRERVAAGSTQMQSEGSLDKFLQDHLHIAGGHHDQETTVAERTAASAGPVLSSSDEWCASSGTEPVRSPHHHRAAGGEAEPDKANCGEGGSCNYGMQQCPGCGLFTSRPEMHTCMSIVSGNGHPSTVG